jgi:uncharacterized RDD family membrane protein YckC
LALCIFAQVAFPAPTTEPSTRPVGPRDLLSHFGENEFWLAQVSVNRDEPRTPYEQTTISFRKRIDSWATTATPISNRVVSLAGNSGELLLVLESGQWMIADGDDIRLGSSPPDGGSVIALANEEEVLWSLVAVGVPVPTTQTGPATEPEIPATEPAPQRLLVYRLDAGKWVSPVDPPFEKLEAAWKVSLAVVDHMPVIAWEPDDGRILVSRLGADGHWSNPKSVSVAPQAIVNFKLLNIEEHTALWVATDFATASTQPGNLADAGTLYAGDDFSKATTLKISGTSVPTGSPQTVEIAFDRLRWLADTGEDQPIEMDYQIDGSPMPNVQPMAAKMAERIPLGPPIGSAVMIMLIAGLAGGSQRKNRAAENASMTGQIKLRLAPLGIRFLAGMVDLLPLLAAVSFVKGPTNSPPDDFAMRFLIGLALLTYVGHTMIAEMLCGQSIGKMVMGLRVVDTNGRQPGPWAIAVRSVLRLLDVCIVPLASVGLTPLHQRIGDVVARTTVVVNETAGASDDGE